MTYGEICWRQVQLASMVMGQCFWYAYLNIVVQNFCYRALYNSWMKPSTSIYCNNNTGRWLLMHGDCDIVTKDELNSNEFLLSLIGMCDSLRYPCNCMLHTCRKIVFWLVKKIGMDGRVNSVLRKQVNLPEQLMGECSSETDADTAVESISLRNHCDFCVKIPYS